MEQAKESESTTEISQPDPQPPVLPPNTIPFQLWMVDMPWPGPNDITFDIEVPQPAMFQRVVRAELADKGGKRRTALRLIWLAKAGGQRARFTVILQRPKYTYAVPADGSGPEPLGTVVTSAGEPIAVWIRPSDEAPLSAVGVE